MHHFTAFRTTLLSVLTLVALLAGGALAVSAQAPPQRLYGSVTLNGRPAPAGTDIIAFVEQQECGRTQVQADGSYILDVLAAATQPGCGIDGSVVTFRVGGLSAEQTATFRSGTFTQLNLTAPGTPDLGRYTASYLNLDDPRPCIPEEGRDFCEPTRAALWSGEAAAWAARGVTDPDARFNETVVFRVRAGDPAAIRNIARILGAPYLKVTRVSYAGTEYAEITNLGGGPQDLTGWTLRSPAREAVFSFPEGVVLEGGESCRVYSAAAGPDSCGADASFGRADVWPDDAGRVVLFFDALALPGDDTRYNANPADQPPPPNLQGDAASLQ